MSNEVIWGALIAAIVALAGAVGLLFRELRKSDAARVTFAEAQLTALRAQHEKLDLMLTKMLGLLVAMARKVGIRD